MKKFLATVAVLACLTQAPLFAAPHDPIVGAYSQIDLTDPEVIGAAHFAVFSLNHDGSDKTFQLEKILSAESQIVAGVNYRMTLALSSEEGPVKIEVVVFHQAWTQTWALVSSKVL